MSFVSLQVTLHLNPISSVHIHQKPLVFLLNSPLPLTWKIKPERLASGIRRFFFVSIQFVGLSSPLCKTACGVNGVHFEKM